MDDYTWTPAEARDAAATFRRALIGDQYSHSRCVAMIRAIVDHARAVRLRCDISAAAARPTMLTEVRKSLLGLAKFTADMHRRGLPDLTVLHPYQDGVTHLGISEATRDAGHDLLMTLIVDVDAEAGHG